MRTCQVCQSDDLLPVYESTGETSITSLCELYPGRTRVFFCNGCGHLQSDEIPNIEKYYDQAYKILINDEEEDQIYKIENDRTIYRIQHQVDTLLRLIEIPKNARILDFGCAKSATMRKLIQSRPDVEHYLFDVSDMYIPFWDKFTPRSAQATYTLPPDWEGSFDIVTSFFSLEHTSDPTGMVRTIHSMLRDNGTIYIVIPYVDVNIADMVVFDHTNHFTITSMRVLLQSCGFSNIIIDTQSHDGAMIAIAHKKTGTNHTFIQPDSSLISDTRERMLQIATYWNNIKNRIVEFEANTDNKNCAIYGSGFYGAFIMSCLRNTDSVSCFIDRNPWRQGQTLNEKPIVSPDDLPEDVCHIYVGLRPEIARQNIAQVDALQSRKIEFFYL